VILVLWLYRSPYPGECQIVYRIGCRIRASRDHCFKKILLGVCVDGGDQVPEQGERSHLLRPSRPESTA
jgi:hypothetical protein